jgi:thiamine-monophosphate kinase
MSDFEENVSHLGEFELIEKIKEMIGKPGRGELWSGDDAAVVHAPEGNLLLTIDTVVEGVDFDLDYATGEEVGWKALAVNVSDVAAMGGRPVHAVASLSVPPATRTGTALGIGRGLATAADRWGVSLVGGDVSRSSEISVTVAVTGRCERPVTRDGASPGDAICVTGTLGGAAGGLAALRAGRGRDFPDLRSRQLLPEARAHEGIEIARSGAHSMIDVSDGLAADLGHLLREGLGCSVHPNRLPIDPSLVTAAPELGLDPLTTAIVGGEDFELLFCMEPDRTGALGAELTAGMTVIGEVTEGHAAIGGRSLHEWKEMSWDHLRSR